MNPDLILIQGLPATGKTSIGKEIATRLALPFLSKDSYKERIFDALNLENPDLAWSKKIGAVSFEVTYLVIEQLLSANVSCVVETAWIHKFAEPAISKILEKYNANLVQVFVTSDPEVRVKRFQERAQTDRHPAHMDTNRLEQNTNESNNTADVSTPLNLPGKLIEIDTTDFNSVNIEDILLKINE